MEDYDKDVLNEFFKNINENLSEDLNSAEKELDNYINKLNELLATFEDKLKFAEEEGDDALYNLELNRRNLVLQKLSELEKYK